tara:strand:+ start:264 stop:803 length:540 start_codon:yes stop_codon:yes gene_type:complete
MNVCSLTDDLLALILVHLTDVQRVAVRSTSKALRRVVSRDAMPRQTNCFLDNVTYTSYFRRRSRWTRFMLFAKRSNGSRCYVSDHSYHFRSVRPQYAVGADGSIVEQLNIESGNVSLCRRLVRRDAQDLFEAPAFVTAEVTAEKRRLRYVRYGYRLSPVSEWPDYNTREAVVYGIVARR